VNTNLQVKQEIPDDIDLLASMPPPSPTDDPLLLSGPPEPVPIIMSDVQETSLAPAPSSPVIPLNTDEIEAVEHFDDYQVEDLSMESVMLDLC